MVSSSGDGDPGVAGTLLLARRLVGLASRKPRERISYPRWLVRERQSSQVKYGVPSMAVSRPAGT